MNLSTAPLNMTENRDLPIPVVDHNVVSEYRETIQTHLVKTHRSIISFLIMDGDHSSGGGGQDRFPVPEPVLVNGGIARVHATVGVDGDEIVSIARGIGGKAQLLNNAASEVQPAMMRIIVVTVPNQDELV
jgi:hypothetical protein